MSGSGNTSGDVRRQYPINQQQVMPSGGNYRGSGRHNNAGSRMPDPHQGGYYQQPMEGQGRPGDKYKGSGNKRQGGGGQPNMAAGMPHQPVAPTTGQMRSGHIEVGTLYGAGGGGNLTVNSMNAPNNSTMQCGCENIDCPFCNQMMSIQMSEGQY